ncbi:MAG: AAA family ATPase [Isosphaeraceae bacterium]|nr:AAA family ATPase [Isosphaeraceae bacterium]
MIDAMAATPPLAFVPSSAPIAQTMAERFGMANQQFQSEADDALFQERLGQLDLLDSAAFASADYLLEWLVKGVLVKGQPAIFGGPKKSLKTSLLIDLALALGTPRGGIRASFLGKFDVPAPIQVGLFSGESGQHTVQETARRVCRARGIELERSGVRWGFNLPRLRNDIDLRVLRHRIEQYGLQVVILDPLYLSLVGGTSQLDAANLFHMGPVLADVANVCLEAGATPILAHHARKARLSPQERWQPLDLDDLAYAGITEFARQWLLVSRREAYQPGTGSHQLWLQVGGSAGFSGLWGLDVQEGTVDEHFGGRRWQVHVKTVDEALQAKRELVEQRKTAGKRNVREDLERKIVSALERCGPMNKTAIAREVKRSNAIVGPALDDLVEAGVLERGVYKQKYGQTCEQFVLVKKLSTDTVTVDQSDSDSDSQTDSSE